MQVPALLQAPRRARERRAAHRGRPRRSAQLAREQVPAEEGEREREEEEEVVADHRGVRPGPDQPGRRVADQRVGEREAVGAAARTGWTGRSSQRLGRQRVAVPGDLPALRQRIAEVERDVRPQVQRERPEQDDGQQRPCQRGQRDLAPAESAERIATRSPCAAEPRWSPSPRTQRNLRDGARVPDTVNLMLRRSSLVVAASPRPPSSPPPRPRSGSLPTSRSSRSRRPRSRR